MGDAAHLFTPTCGLGYNTAVEDAVNLGWKLSSVLKGKGGPKLLETYAQERQPLARRNTAYARSFADSLGLISAPPELEQASSEGDHARTVAGEYFNAHARREFNIPGVTFGGRYDGSPIVVGDGTTPPPDRPNEYVPSACPGGRPPHVWIDEQTSLYDLFGFEWTLLVMHSGVVTKPFEEAAKVLGLDLKIVCPEHAGLFELYEAPLALIRPDQIVAWRGQDAKNALSVLRQANGFLD